MAREITSDELTLLRSEGQWSKLYLAVLKPHTIFTARLASLPDSFDQVVEISYNTGSGILSDVKPGMMLYVGITAGGYELGMCRIRKDPSAGTFYIGLTSEIVWQSNCYLTVVDDFDLWARHAVLADDALVMDVDVAYSDQHANFDPVPVLGSHAVLWLSGATVSVDFDASDSWVFDSSISAYSWSAPGASASSGMTSATPTITYNAAGIYRVLCTVTAANGKTAVGVRYVFVYDDDNPPATVFQLANCEGSVESGGWSFDVTMQAEASLSDIRERTLVILFAKDYYQGTEQSIGPITGRENIIAVGRVGPTESIRWDPVAGQVHFSVYGPYYWMNKLKVSPAQLEFSTAPDNWNEIKNQNVDRALWHLLHWRSTASMLMDFYPTNDTRYDDKATSLGNYLWPQLTEIASVKILAHVLCDRYGRLFAEVNLQMIPEEDRDSFPTVMTVTKDDWADVIDFDRVTAYDVGQVLLSTRLVDTTGTSMLYSLAPGHVPRTYGEAAPPVDGMLAASQAQSNQMAGLYLGWKCNPFPNIPLKLPGNNRMIDICPHQFLDITIEAADTPRGVGYAGNLIPRRVALAYDAEARWLSAAIGTEGETFEQNSSNGDIPDGQGGFVDIPSLGNLPSLKLPKMPSMSGMGFPPTLPTQVTLDCANTIMNFFSLAWSKSFLDGGDPDKLVAKAYFPCKVRSSASIPTYIDFRVKLHGDVASHIHVYGVSGDSRIISATLSPVGDTFFRAHFSPLSDTAVTGFEIEIDEGLGSVLDSYTLGSTVASGSAEALNNGTSDFTTVVDKYYAVDGSGGPWSAFPTDWPGWQASWINYYFEIFDASRASGKVGWMGDAGADFLYLQLGSMGILAEAISSVYGRIIFQAQYTTSSVRCAVDANPGDNYGSIGYTVRNVKMIGRGVEIFGSTLNNVCAA